MASRNGFEVISLKFIFISGGYGRLDWSNEWVREELKKSLKIYASNTNLKYCSACLEEGKIVVNVGFSKEVSFVTVINILSKMFLDKISIEYSEIKKIVTVVSERAHYSIL